MSPASWSISRRPASIPATPPARCRPTPSRNGLLQGSNEQTIALARGLNVVGLMNVQFAVKGERHLCAGGQSARQPHRALRRQGHRRADRQDRRPRHGRREARRHSISSAPARDHVAVKEAVFPFARFPGVDVILGPEMKSTGEVMGIDRNFARAFAKSQLGAGNKLPQRRHRLHLGQGPRQAGDGVAGEAPGGTGLSGFWRPAARPTIWSSAACRWSAINKVLEGRPHIVDAMKNGEVQLVFNTSRRRPGRPPTVSACAATALLNGIPYYTTVAGVRAAVEAIGATAAWRP